MTKYIDAFIFNDEIPMLEFRLRMLSPYVDYFFIVESFTTFAGERKPLHLAESPPAILNEPEFREKVIVYSLANIPDSRVSDPWAREAYQRNEINITNLTSFVSMQDLITISDIDEIPDAEYIRDNINELGEFLVPFVFAHEFFYYTVHTVHKERFLGTMVVTIEALKHLGAQTIRDMRHTVPVVRGGWHFSYFGGIQAVIKKVKEFSHQEYNTEYYLNEQRVTECLTQGKDLFERTKTDWIVNTNLHTLPKYLLDNQDLYPWFFTL